MTRLFNGETWDTALSNSIPKRKIIEGKPEGKKTPLVNEDKVDD